MYKKTKRVTVSFILVLLSTLLFANSSLAADSSTVQIYPGEYIKTTRPIYVGPGGTMHIEVVGETPGATINFKVRRYGGSSSEASITSGTVVGVDRKAYPVTLHPEDGYGEFILILETSIGKSRGYGKLSTY